jgi:hypothetical protein
LFWMEILIEAKIIDQTHIQPLFTEANEILKVVSSARKTLTV